LQKNQRLQPPINFHSLASKMVCFSNTPTDLA
jgi:hypothetical protein